MIKKLILFLLATALAVFVSYRVAEALKNRDNAGPGASRGRPAVTVQAVTVESHTFNESVDLMGELRPQARVDILPRTSGRLRSVLVEKGDRVARGRLLAEIDDEELQQQAVRGEATLRVAEATLRQQETNLQHLMAQQARLEQLYDAQLISLQDVEDVRTRVEAARAQKELAEAQISQVRAEMAETKIQLEQTRLYSPLSGFVGERFLDPGAMVSASTPILTVIDLSQLKTVAGAPENQLRHLRPGLKGRVMVDAYPDERFDGIISRISPLLDPATRSAEVEIIIPNPGFLLKAGMFARVQILVRSTDSLAVPRESLVTRGERSGVFLVEDGTVRFADIRTGLAQNGRLQVLAGLNAGDTVVRAGAQFLNEGDTVRVE